MPLIHTVGTRKKRKEALVKERIWGGLCSRTYFNLPIAFFRKGICNSPTGLEYMIHETEESQKESDPFKDFDKAYGPRRNI